MTVLLSTQLDTLRRERDRLDELLMLDANWRALQQLEAREAAGELMVSVDGAALKESLIEALAGNRVFVARAKLVETIELLAADMPPLQPAGVSPEGRSGVLDGTSGEAFRTRVRLKGDAVAGDVGAAADTTATKRGRRLRDMLGDGSMESEVRVILDTAPHEPVNFRAGRRPSTLLNRLKALSPLKRFDGDDYAAYRGRVEEASVTIIKSRVAGSEPIAKTNGEAVTDGAGRDEPPFSQRLLRALMGKRRGP